MCLLVDARRISGENEAKQMKETIKIHISKTKNMYNDAKNTMLGKMNTLKVGHVMLHHSSWFFIYLNAFAQGIV